MWQNEHAFWLISYSFELEYICCNLAGSVGSQQHWLWDIAEKEINFYCFLLLWELFNCSWPWNHWTDSSGVFSKMYLSKWALQSNRKLKMSHVGVPTDPTRYCITYASSSSCVYVYLHKNMSQGLWKIIQNLTQHAFFSFLYFFKYVDLVSNVNQPQPLTHYH